MNKDQLLNSMAEYDLEKHNVMRISKETKAKIDYCQKIVDERKSLKVKQQLEQLAKTKEGLLELLKIMKNFKLVADKMTEHELNKFYEMFSNRINHVKFLNRLQDYLHKYNPFFNKNSAFNSSETQQVSNVYFEKATKKIENTYYYDHDGGESGYEPTKEYFNIEKQIHNLSVNFKIFYDEIIGKITKTHCGDEQ